MAKNTGCHACGSAPTGWHFLQPQLSPSIVMEAFQAASLVLVVGPFAGPLAYAAVGNRLLFTCKSHGYTAARHNTTKIVHYKRWDGRLHPMGAHSGKVTSDHKSNVHYQKWSQSQIQIHTFIANVLMYYPLSPIGQNSNTHNFLTSYQNWVLFNSLAF